jgi:hypothetical protein
MRLRYDPPGPKPGNVKIGVDGPSGARHFFRASRGFECDIQDDADAAFLLGLPGFSRAHSEASPRAEAAPTVDLQHLDRAGLNALAAVRGRKFHHKTSDAKVRDELAAMLAKELTDADDAGTV